MFGGAIAGRNNGSNGPKRLEAGRDEIAQCVGDGLGDGGLVIVRGAMGKG